MNSISETDLIFNADGSIYHLNLLPGDVADTVITVGDPDRVGEVSRYFDSIELKKGKREFITHTGYIGKKRLTVISTGIGTDNIDIVFNELDALINIDLESRTVNSSLKSLDVIRIGTSGAVQPDIPVDSILYSEAAIGLDPLMHYYQQSLNWADEELLAAFKALLPLNFNPYFARGSKKLLSLLAPDQQQGLTVTAPGFYAAQGREVRAAVTTPHLISLLQNFNFSNKRITNLEMETAGIYGLAASLGHNAISCNVILANRATNTFSKQPGKVMDKYIQHTLQQLATI